MLRKVSDLQPGDVVDLQRDRYADPDGAHPVYAVECVEVSAVEPEEDGWVRLLFEGLPAVSFPADHLLPANTLDAGAGLPGPR